MPAQFERRRQQILQQKAVVVWRPQLGWYVCDRVSLENPSRCIIIGISEKLFSTTANNLASPVLASFYLGCACYGDPKFSAGVNLSVLLWLLFLAMIWQPVRDVPVITGIGLSPLRSCSERTS